MTRQVHILLAVLSLVWMACTAREVAPLNLSQAAAAGNVAAARSLLDEGADPERPLFSGLTPLMRAAVRNDPDMIEVLISGGADVDADGTEGITALHAAAQMGADRSAVALLEHGADLSLRSTNGMNALDHAASTGRTGAMTEFLEAGLDIDTPSEVVTQGHGHPRDTGPTPIAIAVLNGRLMAVDELIRLGADVNARSAAGHTPLLAAIFSDQSPEMLLVLLVAGADPTVRVGCDAGCHVAGLHDALGWARLLDREALIGLLRTPG